MTPRLSPPFVSRLLLILLSLATVATGYVLWPIKADVDRAATRLTLTPGPQSTVIFDAKDRPISALYREHRLPVSLEEMSDDADPGRAGDRGPPLLRTRRHRPAPHSGLDAGQPPPAAA